MGGQGVWLVIRRHIFQSAPIADGLSPILPGDSRCTAFGRGMSVAGSKPCIGHRREGLGFGCGPRLLWGDARF